MTKSLAEEFTFQLSQWKKPVLAEYPMLRKINELIVLSFFNHINTISLKRQNSTAQKMNSFSFVKLTKRYL